MAYTDQIISRQEVKYKKKNKDTFKRLTKSKFGTVSKCSKHNLSSKQLSEQKLFTLSVGLNFSLPGSNIDKKNIKTCKKTNELKVKNIVKYKAPHKNKCLFSMKEGINFFLQN